MAINIGLIGIGTIGSGVVRILKKNYALIKKRSNLDIRITKIADLNNMVVRVDIPEIDRTKVREGMSVNMSFDAYPDKVVTGKIYDIAQISKTTKAGTFFEAFIEFVNLKDIDISDLISGRYDTIKLSNIIIPFPDNPLLHEFKIEEV